MARHLQFSQQDYPPFGDLSPASLDSLTMSGTGRLTEAGTPPIAPYAQYASLPAQGFGSGEMAPPYAVPHGQQVLVQSQGLQPMISQFIHDRVAPWNHLRLNADPVCGDLSARRQPAGAHLSPDFSSFGSFRSAPPPSEADTVNQSLVGVLSDSGYGSMTRQSVGNPSVCGGDVDQSFETQSLISRFQVLTPELSSPRAGSRKRAARSQKPTLDNATANARKCPDCTAAFKTPSELKKHQARHQKPHKCDVPGCPRGLEGFSNNNDLDRHRRCVHKLRKPDETVYRCNLDQCRDKPKDWPRPDNFRQHLKRKHKINPENVDLSQFRCPAPAEAAASDMIGFPDPSDESPWSGLDQGHVAPSRLINSNTIQSSAENLLSTSRTAEAPQFQGGHLPAVAPLHLDTGPVLPGVGISCSSAQGASSAAVQPPSEIRQPGGVARDLVSPTASKEVLQSAVDHHPPEPARVGAPSEADGTEVTAPDGMHIDDDSEESASEDGLHDIESKDDGPFARETDVQDNLLRDAGAQYSQVDNASGFRPSSREVQLGPGALKSPYPSDETRASELLQSLMDNGTLDKLLKQIGYPVPAVQPEVNRPELLAGLSAASGSSRVNRCGECNKTFNRRCELKKHQKRHAKPYACTFRGCDRKFGSKNDWKRHENSQHFQHEFWRCGEQAAERPDQQCGKVYHRRESLKAHLEKDHGIREHAVLDEKLPDYRMGRNFELRFWCGFCQKTIEPSGGGGPAHSERFDHIDDHFNGRGGLPKADIKDWKHVDPDDPADAPGCGSPDGGGREGSSSAAVAGDYSRGIATSRQDSSSRKRGRDSPGDASEDSPNAKKRLKDSEGAKKVVFWTCCSCGNYWRQGSTITCLDACNHAYCDGCVVFEQYSAS